MDHKDKISGKKVLKLENKSETRAEIAMYGVIGESFWDDAISANTFHRMLNDLPSTVNELDIRLNSPGGDVFDGMTIYNRIRSFDGTVNVYVDGLAASIASIIMLAGDKVVMGHGSMVMIHKPMTFAYGNANELQDRIDTLNDVEDQLVRIYKNRTDLEAHNIRNLLAEETWFDSTQAIEKGFADEMIEDDEAIEVAAYLDMANFIKKKPQNMRTAQTHMKNKLSGITERMNAYKARL